MKLSLLRELCAWMGDMSLLIGIKRKAENLFMLVLKDKMAQRHILYFDMTRGRSGVFMTDEEIMSVREFSAPFDHKLQTCCAHTHIKQVQIDGRNRILQILLCQKERYKLVHFRLQFEFTGRHTNVILCDERFCVIEALRHISLNKSWREVRVGELLLPLPQPEGENKELDLPNALCTPHDTRENREEALRTALYATYEKYYKSLQVQKSSAIIASLQAKCENLIALRENLPIASNLQAQAKQYAAYGELLFSMLHTLPTQKVYSPILYLKNIQGETVELPIPSCARTLSEAGNWYFAQSKKLIQKAKNIHKQSENLEKKISFFQDKIAFLQKNNELSEIFIKQTHKKREQKSARNDIECFFIEDFKISIGRNIKENQQILSLARADDMWFHIRDVPSAHMIIHCGKRMPPYHVIEKAGAILCGLYAARKGGGNFIVDYTRRRFVKSSGKAQVVYGKHESLGIKV